MVQKLVAIPGPTPVVRSIQDEMGREIVAFGDPSFVKDYKELLNDMMELWDATGQVFVIAGTGTMAMEMAIANTMKSGDNILIVSHGFFGNRFIEICERRGINVDLIQSEWGQIVPVADIEKKLSEKHYHAMTVTHVDTSTGVAAPVAEIGEMMKKFPETLYIVDGVCATAAEPEKLNSMNIDILLTGSQKAFGVCPGLAILWASEKALARRKSFGMIPDYYVDFEKWIPIMEDPSKYFATPAVNLIWALKESVNIIKKEGIENRYQRHIKYAKATQAALEALGFTILAEKDHRAVTLSNVLYMDGVNDAEFRKILAEEGAVVAGGLAAYAGKMFRFGHMGNIDEHYLVSVLGAIERTLVRCGIEIEMGKGVGTLLANLR
ncbi:pyridoxal-phosphate-dependent aminotransferase family protein [Tissierella praeacuta]|uniref:pyridoxal-phosphate-dependent aminotransferase family protein n=1 Tax=Tissierella praeacuta TaxID=43131 RepID=UPI000ECF182D|nr:alanine--glyoxylate aminotransferase family protein [Tissierella praeacuta]MBU5255591.1 alanine--glyoxylate aminotransferase family protein [Tissierella praeacuta]TCU79128.1 aspartate aminotransferase-like enzyme [Tissierella praeacuta]HAE92386.1 aminotransferase [Tissierella sp.]